MATFGALKDAVLKDAGVSDHFAYIGISEAHQVFWDTMNNAEFMYGHDPVEYHKPGTPPLCDMDLLTDAEFRKWFGRRPVAREPDPRYADGAPPDDET